MGAIQKLTIWPYFLLRDSVISQALSVPDLVHEVDKQSQSLVHEVEPTKDLAIAVGRDWPVPGTRYSDTWRLA